MRLNRAKQMRKHLRFYRIVYGVAPPYAVLLDGNFIHMALKVKMDIKDRIKKLLLGEDFACFVPRAVLDELAALGPACAASLQWAQACCEVLENPQSVAMEEKEEGEATPAMTAGDAIRALVGARNEGKYMVATQDQELKADLRHVPSVALMFVARAVLLMEPPSTASRQASAKVEGDKFRHLSEEERALVAAIKGHRKGKGDHGAGHAAGPGAGAGAAAGAGGALPKVRLKKKAKGPNPLSVKKSKPAAAKSKSNSSSSSSSSSNSQGGGEAAKKKRKRKHKKAKAETGGG